MTGDLYPRPDRNRIAEQVNGRQPPGTRNDDDLDDAATPPERSAAQNFAVHLSARMRARGWDAGTLAAKTGLHVKTVSRAVNGNGIEMAGAEKLALAAGGYLAAMIGPYMCSTCSGEPPEGYACLECGTETRAS